MKLCVRDNYNIMIIEGHVKLKIYNKVSLKSEQ